MQRCERDVEPAGDERVLQLRFGVPGVDGDGKGSAEDFLPVLDDRLRRLFVLAEAQERDLERGGRRFLFRGLRLELLHGCRIGFLCLLQIEAGAFRRSGGFPVEGAADGVAAVGNESFRDAVAGRGQLGDVGGGGQGEAQVLVAGEVGVHIEKKDIDDVRVIGDLEGLRQVLRGFRAEDRAVQDAFVRLEVGEDVHAVRVLFRRLFAEDQGALLDVARGETDVVVVFDERERFPVRVHVREIVGTVAEEHGSGEAVAAGRLVEERAVAGHGAGRTERGQEVAVRCGELDADRFVIRRGDTQLRGFGLSGVNRGSVPDAEETGGAGRLRVLGDGALQTEDEVVRGHRGVKVLDEVLSERVLRRGFGAVQIGKTPFQSVPEDERVSEAVIGDAPVVGRARLDVALLVDADEAFKTVGGDGRHGGRVGNGGVTARRDGIDRETKGRLLRRAGCEQQDRHQDCQKAGQYFLPHGCGAPLGKSRYRVQNQ